jgi:hypothetical protein
VAAGENELGQGDLEISETAGEWPQIAFGEQSVLGGNSEPASLHRSWLDMDRVDPC